MSLMDAGVRHSTLKKELDGTCLFKENEGRSAQRDFVQVAMIAIFLNSTSAR